MVKPDVKHNYYADLDLPVNSSIDDVRKAYRKLALQFHPDRNAGKEAECVPRFQAIQAANEVLSDPTTKARYDTDRRKAGLYGAATAMGGTSYKPTVPTPGNPYAATSNFPPPPRRTQPGQSAYQRSGADRFTNFPRAGAANTAPRKDPASERTEQFRAWQSMNTGTAGTKQTRPVPPPPPGASPRPQAAPTRPAMPNRQDTKLPSEEQIRAGMRHGKASGAAPSSPETLNARQTAWQEYGKNGPSTRSKAQRPAPAPATPRRPGGFDPNAPGSDERAAPQSSHYNRRNRSEDFTDYPPPPPGPPPASQPQSPTSPQAHRPYADPLRSFKQREDAPYMEGNRTSTPYSSVSGEKTQFSSDGLRRSASTRDTTKLQPESPASSTRARSTSPVFGRQQDQQQQHTNGKQTRGAKASFVPGMESSSSEASSDDARTAPRERKIAQPKPRSHRFPNHAPSPSPKLPTDGNQSEMEQQPNMEQRKSSLNMYARPSLSSTARSSSGFSRKKWFAANFGHGETTVPRWAMPSCILPSFGHRKPRRPVSEVVNAPNELLQEVERDAVWRESSTDQRRAYLFFRTQSISRDSIASDLKGLGMADFYTLVEMVRSGASTDFPAYDALLSDVLTRYPSVGRKLTTEPPADQDLSADRFSIPIHPDTFTPTSAKSRSVENINTNFSPEGWSGKFAGSTDYFAPDGAGRRPSPARRTGSRRGLYTPDSGSPRGGSMPPPPPPDSTRPMSGSVPPPPPDSTRPVPLNSGKFSEEEWKSTFKDASWTWPPPPPANESKPGLRSKTGSRQTGKLSSKSSYISSASNSSNHATSGTRASPLVVDDDEAVADAEPDAMDIDTPPPAKPVQDAAEKPTPTQPGSTPKEARNYSVPVSGWRQQQEASRGESPSAKRQARSTPAESTLKTNLDDLANVEPIARSADGGLRNLADLGSTLPFASQPSTAGPGNVKEVQPLQLPPIPKAPAVPHKWTKTSWHYYAQAFNAYLQAHHEFNRTLLQHFETREKSTEARMKYGGSGWLEAQGGVFEDYLREVKQDEKVRECWALAGERHLEAVMGFEGRREQVRRIVNGGGLVD